MPELFKKLITISVFIHLSYITYAQIEWTRHFGEPNMHEYIQAIEADPENGKIWAIGVTGSVGNDDFFLSELDTFGNILRIDTFGSPGHNEYVLSFSRDPHTGTLWLGGYRISHEDRQKEPLLFQFDSAGKLVREIFDFRSTPDNYGFHSVHALADGGVLTYLTGTNLNNTTPNFRKYDSNGQRVFNEQPWDANTNRPVQSFAALPDGRFFTIRAYGNTSSSFKRIELSFRSPQNAIIWKKDIKSPTDTGKGFVMGLILDPADSTAIISHQDNNNQRYLTKMDIEGNQIWQVKTENVWVSGFSPLVRQLIIDRNVIGILYETGIELRDSKTGALISVNNFAEEVPEWSRSIQDGVFFASGNYMVGGVSDKTNFYIQNADAYIAIYDGKDNKIKNEVFIGSPGIIHNDFNPIVEESSGYIFMANNIFTEKTETVIRKINKEDGSIVWENKYSAVANENVEDIITLADGNLLLTCDQQRLADTLSEQILLRKIDPADGEIIWEQQRPNPGSTYFIRTTSLDDGGAIVFFQGSIPFYDWPFSTFLHYQIQAIRINAVGEEMWRKTYLQSPNPQQVSAQTILENVITLPDGSVAVVGGIDKTAGLVIRINPEDGESIFIQTLDSVDVFNDRRATHIQQAENGSIVVLSRPYQLKDSVWIYQLTMDGTVLRRKSYLFGDSHYGSSLHKLPDGNILALISSSFLNTLIPGGLRVLQLDDKLETKYEQILFDRQWRPFDALLLSDGSLAMTREYRPTNSPDIQLVKTKMLPVVSVENFDRHDFSIKIYPNPLPDGQVLHIELENSYRGPIIIEISGIDGRVYQTFSEHKDFERHKSSIHLTNPITGQVLMVKCIAGNNVYVKGIVKI